MFKSFDFTDPEIANVYLNKLYKPLNKGDKLKYDSRQLCYWNEYFGKYSKNKTIPDDFKKQITLLA